MLKRSSRIVLGLVFGGIVVATNFAEAQSPKDAELSKGLWAYWKFDEGKGLHSYCKVQEQNRGSFDGRPFYRWSEGKFGKAVEFFTPPGVKSWKSAGMRFPSYEDPISDGLIKGMTVSVWIHVPRNGLGVGIPLLGRYDREGEPWDKLDSGWKLSTHAHQVLATSTLVRGDGESGEHKNVGTRGWSRTDENDLFDDGDAWHHLVLVSDPASNELTLYLDNDAVIRKVSHEHDGIGPASLGDLRIGWVGNLNLRYDEMAIWKRALTPDEVSHLFNEGKGRQITPPNSQIVLDRSAPSPNPMRWWIEPTATGPTAIGMYAQEATDHSDYFGLEYRFVCLDDERFSSDWQRSPLYIATGLSPDTEYRFACQARDKMKNKNATKPSPAVRARTHKETTGKLRVFVIAGQSNAVGWAALNLIEGDTHLSAQDKRDLLLPRDDVFARTHHGAGYLNTRAKTRPEIPEAIKPYGFGGKPSHYGVELASGRAFGQAFDDDVLVTKLAVGGTFLHNIWFRDGERGWKKPETWFPRSSVKDLGDSLGRELKPGALYVKLENLLKQIRESPGDLCPDYRNQGVEIAGFIWFQGESDSFDLPVPYGPDAAQHRWESPALYHHRNLENLIADVRDAAQRPDLPVVIVQIQDKSTWDGTGNADIRVFGKTADQKVSREEFETLEKRSDPFRKMTLSIDELFAQADKDGDGALSGKEFDHPAFKQQVNGKGPMIRKAQADVAAADKNAMMIPTSNLSKDFHYGDNAAAMVRIGERVAGAMLKLLGTNRTAQNETAE